MADLPNKQRDVDRLVSAGDVGAYKSTKVPGMYLEVISAGVGRYKVRFEKVGGRARRQQGKHTLGDAKIITIGQAEDAARQFLATLQTTGKDPRGDKAGATYAAIYSDWLVAPSRKKALRARTLDEYERINRLHVEPRIGAVPMGQLDKATIKAAVEAVRQSTTDEARGHRGLQATKALKLIRSVCNYAVDCDYIANDPTRGLDFPVPDANPAGKQHRPPNDEELRKIWLASAKLSPTNERLLRLAILIGKRVSELIGIRKEDVTLGTESSLFIGIREGNKSGVEQRVPLPPMAAAILKAAIADAGQSPFVFPASGANRATDRGTPSHAFTDLRRAIGLGDGIRLHDMRGLIVDQLAKMGVPGEYRSHVLHHTGDMRASLADRVYSTYDHAAEKRRALELWERRLLEVVEMLPPSGLRW